MEHPIRLAVAEGLERNRLTTAFRIILAIPHLVWLSLWGIAVGIAVIVAWFAALFTGRVPDALHGFMAQFLRYLTHVYGYVLLMADPFPGFLGDRPYPVDLAVAPPETQNRWIVAFRVIMAIPAALLSQALGYVIYALAVLSWFAILFTGRQPLGLRDLTAFVVRFNQQFHGYLLLLTERYPDFSPGPPR
jgi:hypothetical protein